MVSKHLQIIPGKVFGLCHILGVSLLFLGNIVVVMTRDERIVDWLLRLSMKFAPVVELFLTSAVHTIGSYCAVRR